MNIYIMRHGQAVHPSSWHRGDEIRPLSKEGKKEAAKAAQGLARAALSIQKILSSPFDRARETAEIVGKELGLAPMLIKDLASGAKAEHFRKVVSVQPETSILVVGHIPDLLAFACRLINDALIMEEGLETAEVIAIETPPIHEGWAGGQVLWRKSPESW